MIINDRYKKNELEHCEHIVYNYKETYDSSIQYIV